MFALLCGLASSFALLIAGRIAMGASAAVTRVLVISMVRDLFEAESMARVMSLVFMTFMLVPVLAPNIGQAILLVAPWRAIFIVLAALRAGDAGLVVDPAARDASPRISPLAASGARWRGAMLDTVRERQSLGYTLAMTVTFAGLVAYISSIQQIVFEVFDAPQLIGLVFASIAAPMALASYGQQPDRRALRAAPRRPRQRAAAGGGHRDPCRHRAQRARDACRCSSSCRG